MGNLTPISHMFAAYFSASILRKPLILLGLRRVRWCRRTLRYVGSRVGAFHTKWTRVGTSPRKSLVSNRFLASANEFLTFSEAPGVVRPQGDHVRRDVDGGMSGQFDFESRSLAEKPL